MRMSKLHQRKRKNSEPKKQRANERNNCDSDIHTRRSNREGFRLPVACRLLARVFLCSISSKELKKSLKRNVFSQVLKMSYL